eukprot:3599821-Prymnesium_polylepis.1
MSRVHTRVQYIHRRCLRAPSACMHATQHNPHVTRGRVVAECVARTNVWPRVQSCGLCPADFASGRVELSNANSVVEAHGRAA